MGVARGLAGHGAQAEALGRVEARGPDAAVIERDHLALAVFQEQLAVIGAGQRPLQDAFRPRAVEIGEEQAVGDRERRVERHGMAVSSGGERRQQPGFREAQDSGRAGAGHAFERQRGALRLGQCP